MPSPNPSSQDGKGDLEVDLRKTNHCSELRSTASTVPSKPYPSPQFRVFSNQTLLHLILLQCSTETKSASKSQILLWIALTCSPFFNGAISLLWRRINSWVPLLTLIPAVVREGDTLTMNGIIQEKDLARFDFYAQHVKAFNPQTKDVHVLPHIYSFITQYRHTGVFPNLRKLTVNVSAISSQHAPSLLLLASASLIYVELEDIGSENELFAASLLHNVSIRSPALATLRMHGVITPTTLDLIIQFKGLKEFAISQNPPKIQQEEPDIRPYFFLGIAALQRLTVVTLDLRFVKVSRWSSASLNALRSLTVVGAPDVVYRILCVITATQLRNLNVVLVGSYKQTSRQLLEPFTHRVATMGISAQTIRIASSTGNCTLIPHGLVFQQILSCKYLVELSIPIDILTHDILSSSLCSGRRWPGLKVLKFQYGRGILGTEPLFLSQIESLLVIFPNLLKLSIPISLNMNAVEIEKMDARIKIADTHYGLEELFLGAVASTSRFGFDQCYKEFGPRSESFRQKLILGQFIDHLFPHLKKLYTSGLNYISRCYQEDLRTAVEAFHEKGQLSNTIVKACRHM